MLTGTIRPTQLKIQTKGDGKTIFCLKDRLSNWMSQRVTTIWAAGVPALHRSFADIQFDMVLCSYRCNHAGNCKILHPPFDWKIFREGPPVIRSPPQSPTKHLHCIPMPPISMHQPSSTCDSGLHWLSFFGNLNVTTSAVEAGGKGVVGWVPSSQKSPEKNLPLRPCQPPVLVPPCDTLTFAGWQQLHHMAMAKVWLVDNFGFGWWDNFG